jgi:hypothetical protein
MIKHLGACLFLFAGTSCGSPVQSDHQFKQALQNSSSSPSLVKIRLVDQHGGTEHDQCVFAQKLVRAVAVEHRLPWSRLGRIRAYCIALRTPGHRFVLDDATAVAELGVGERTRNELAKGCAIINRGKPAVRDDMSGFIVEGEPPLIASSEAAFAQIC